MSFDSDHLCGISPNILAVLVCPATRTGLTLDTERCELVSRAANLAYPIIDGIPHLDEANARKLDGE